MHPIVIKQDIRRTWHCSNASFIIANPSYELMVTNPQIPCCGLGILCLNRIKETGYEVCHLLETFHKSYKGKEVHNLCNHAIQVVITDKFFDVCDFEDAQTQAQQIFRYIPIRDQGHPKKWFWSRGWKRWRIQRWFHLWVLIIVRFQQGIVGKFTSQRLVKKVACLLNVERRFVPM